MEELRRQYADLGLPTRAPQPKVPQGAALLFRV